MAVDASPSHSGNPTDEELLTAALSGNQPAWRQLTNRFQAYLISVVRRRAADLPADLREEIINEVWAAVFRRGSAGFDPLAISARHYIAYFVKDGTDRVRAEYRAPGQRSRARDARRSRARTTRQQRRPELSLVSVDRLRQKQHPHDRAHESRLEQLMARIDVDRARVVAPPAVAMAIDLVRYRGASYGEAARFVGLNRVTLLRRLRELADRLRAA